MNTTHFFTIKILIAGILGVLATLGCSSAACAQQKMPRPMIVSANPAEGLRFGAFFESIAGGTIVLSTTGSRTCTGSVIGADLGFVYGAASYDINSEPGTLISVINGPDATLYGSAGGTMTMHIGNSYPASPFITTAAPPVQTTVKIGGTLTVGSSSANPPGNYTGSFTVTFVQE